MRVQKYNRRKRRNLKIAICAVAIGVIICTAFLISEARPKAPKPVEYTIYAYPDGAAEIEVDNIGKIIQTHDEIQAGDMVLKAGTIILPGNGNKIHYEYPRKDAVKGE